MSKELQLLYLDFDAPKGATSYSRTMFNLGTVDELGDDLEALADQNGTSAPEAFRTELGDDNNSRLTTEDYFGDTIRCLTAEQLLQFKDHERVISDSITKGAWAFIGCMESEKRFALFWR